MTTFSSFAEGNKYLKHIKLTRSGGLQNPERFRAILARLSLKGWAPAVQIVGTKGKGSTATFLATLATAHGLHTGLLTTPSFVSFCENFRFDGAPVDEQKLIEATERVLAAEKEPLHSLELTTAIAAVLFSDNAVDFIVLETGLGGEYDSVTQLPVDAVAFTPIGFDHCNLLGSSVQQITMHKAGAIRPGKPVFSARQTPTADVVLTIAAIKDQCRIQYCKGKRSLPAQFRDGSLLLGLAGEHQYTNAGLAYSVWKAMADKHGWQTDENKEIEALQNTFIPARFQFVPGCPEKSSPPIILDGATNPMAMTALKNTLDANDITPASLIFTIPAGKDYLAMAKLAREITNGPIFIPRNDDSPYCSDPEYIATFIGDQAVPVLSIQDALRAAYQVSADQPTVICILYLCGQFFSLYPEYLTKIKPPSFERGLYIGDISQPSESR